MSDNKQQSFQAGQAAGQAEEKSNVLLDKAKDAAAATGASAQTAGQKVTEAGGGAVNVVKENTGMNK
ncbi:stress-induced protein KIN2 [Eutrema salsugineum]|uniref:stress-induced protein KIN2 n=1 Tax=Eutrema salsugineum TaxID=72664 RepID=UPI000CED15C7|nr:stress-induced protein KIN2 [Eutrema salsugineum]